MKKSIVVGLTLFSTAAFCAEKSLVLQKITVPSLEEIRECAADKVTIDFYNKTNFFKDIAGKTIRIKELGEQFAVAWQEYVVTGPEYIRNFQKSSKTHILKSFLGDDYREIGEELNKYIEWPDCFWVDDVLPESFWTDDAGWEVAR